MCDNSFVGSMRFHFVYLEAQAATSKRSFEIALECAIALCTDARELQGKTATSYARILTLLTRQMLFASMPTLASLSVHELTSDHAVKGATPVPVDTFATLPSHQIRNFRYLGVLAGTRTSPRETLVAGGCASRARCDHVAPGVGSVQEQH